MKDLFIEDYELVYAQVEGKRLCSFCAFDQDAEMCENEKTHPCLSKDAKGKVWKLKQQQNETNN